MRIPPFRPLDGLTLIRSASAVLLAAGVGVWSALLFAPAPADAPPMLAPPAVQGADTSPLAQWFGGGAARLRVSVVGLIGAGEGAGGTTQAGAALLQINGGAPLTYRVGQTLAPGVTLTGVHADGVLIDQDGAIEHIPAPARPAAVPGFVSAQAPQEPA